MRRLLPTIVALAIPACAGTLGVTAPAAARGTATVQCKGVTTTDFANYSLFPCSQRKVTGGIGNLVVTSGTIPGSFTARVDWEAGNQTSVSGTASIKESDSEAVKKSCARVPNATVEEEFIGTVTDASDVHEIGGPFSMEMCVVPSGGTIEPRAKAKF